MTTSSGLDTWSVISGAIGVLTVFPFIWAYVRSQHPETKLAELDSTLNDTEALLRSVVEEGLLHPVMHVPHFESRLKNFRAVAEKLRDDTFIASVEWRKLLRAWYDGLTKEISVVCTQVKGVRANICETSASTRMQLTQQRTEDSVSLSFHRKWHAKVTKLWRCIISLACRSPNVYIDNVGASTTLVSSTANIVVASAEDAGTETVVQDDAATLNSDTRYSRTISTHIKSTRASSHVPCTASRTHELRVLSRAIRRVDRELAVQGVTNARLTQLVQATHKRWSPASSKAYHSRRPCKHSILAPRTKHVLVLQPASEPGADFDTDSFVEETMCEV